MGKGRVRRRGVRRSTFMKNCEVSASFPAYTVFRVRNFKMFRLSLLVFVFKA